MTILGIPLEKSIIIVLFASSLFALIFSIMSFMGKVNGIKNYTADGITEEKTTPDKKENILSGFVFLSFSLTSFVGAMKYLTNIAILGYQDKIIISDIEEVNQNNQVLSFYDKYDYSKGNDKRIIKPKIASSIKDEMIETSRLVFNECNLCGLYRFDFYL